MENWAFRSYRLSRLMLGTVQFGLDYGVANKSGQPPYEAARDMVAAAWAAGVNCFDTAAAYGNSEEVLGRAFAELGISKQAVVVTKIRSLAAAGVDAAGAPAWIEASLTGSLRALRLDCVPVCMFHDERDIGHYDILAGLQRRGLVRHIGASAETAAGAAAIVDNPGFEAIQLPVNIFERRFDTNGVMARAAARRMAVFARSVYLQGLLLMPEEAMPEGIRSQAAPVRRSLEEFARARGLGLAELCMRYALARPEVSCVLTGVDTAAQLAENVGLFAKGPLAPDVFTAARDLVPDFPEQVVRPGLWATAKAQRVIEKMRR